MKIFLTMLASLVAAVLFAAFMLPANQRSVHGKIVPAEDGALLASSAGPGSGGAASVNAIARPTSGQKAVGEKQTPDLGAPEETKSATLERINEAMTTYSAEGLPTLKAYLSNSDPEIRAAALEAIIQLAVPEGAQVLREAAKSAKTAREQIEMLEGAEFLELPRLPVGELKKLIQSGAIRVPQQLPGAGD